MTLTKGNRRAKVAVFEDCCRNPFYINGLKPVEFSVARPLESWPALDQVLHNATPGENMLLKEGCNREDCDHDGSGEQF